MTESSISAMLPFHITQPFTYLLIIPTYNAYHNMYSFLNLGLSNILATHYINRVSFFFDVLKARSKLVCHESGLLYCPQIYVDIFSGSQFIYATLFLSKHILIKKKTTRIIHTYIHFSTLN